MVKACSSSLVSLHPFSELVTMKAIVKDHFQAKHLITIFILNTFTLTHTLSIMMLSYAGNQFIPSHAAVVHVVSFQVISQAT